MRDTFVALTIAGSDSGGGAGIQADLKTFSALGVYGASVITAITAQNTRTVAAVEAVTPAMVAAQIETVLADIAVHAAKFGMLGGSDTIAAACGALRGRGLSLVVDPVMVAKSGDALLRTEAVAALKAQALPMATLLTPNLPEAAVLLGTAPARDLAEMAAQGRALLALGPKAVLMKGGHGGGDVCTDLLVTESGVQSFCAQRQATKNTHGTGCTLSAAITAGLAQGMPLAEATARAHGWLQKAIATADRLGVGQGHGPVHHFHEVWTHV